MNTLGAGRWHRSGNDLVIDLEPHGVSHGDGNGYGYEFEAEITPAQRAALTRALDAARRDLKVALKDMKALKSWVGMGPDAQPFLDAFTAARNKAKSLAPAYTRAASAFILPASPNLVDARKLLQDFLEDMDSLKEPAVNGLDPQIFMDAFTAARHQALQAASLYTAAATPP